jgi:aspartate kinase
MELSYFGAKVMHPRSIEPAMRKNILVRVKNTFNPSHPGTVIIRNGQRDNRVVKALTYIDKVAAININGAQMIGRPGVAKAIFTILADHEVNVMMISQGSSEANISFVVNQQDGPRAVRVLHDEFRLSEESDE